MKVKDLIEALSLFDGDLEVIVPSDDEGNDWVLLYHPSLVTCVEDDSYTAGWVPADDDDIEDGEYEGVELRKFVSL